MQTPIAGTSDKVQVMRTVSAMQSAGHEQPIVSAASYPPLPKSQERGTQSFKTGNRETNLKGRATRQDYCPNLLQNYKFTGKERDAESGLDNFGARYDASSLGRFMTPDPLLNSGRPGNPQTWNRYAYVLNNPLRFTDPTGLWEWAANTCAGDDKKCNKKYQDDQKKFRQGLKDLEKARDSYKQWSREHNRLNASLKAYGTENDGNNVTVGFGALPSFSVP